jgi:hypothetical protein
VLLYGIYPGGRLLGARHRARSFVALVPGGNRRKLERPAEVAAKRHDVYVERHGASGG